MFGEWVTRGVGIGVTIFFSVFALLVCCGIVVGLCALFAGVLREDDR